MIEEMLAEIERLRNGPSCGNCVHVHDTPLVVPPVWPAEAPSFATFQYCTPMDEFVAPGFGATCPMFQKVPE